MGIPPAKNLFQVKQRAKAILVLMHLEDCPWCHFVINEVFDPMIELKEYTDKLVIRQIEIDSSLALYDFDGSQIDGDVFAHRYNVDFYPTVLLFDARGQLLEKIIGVASEETYWTDLDKLLNKQGIL
ncbi:MAG: hypothetical protein DSY43_06900 [Gammaproteobacteria bacterium]|uniref:Thioredoxin-like fold domain-containing protein n=1 Tax=endosymbiont of Bathymodiolus septemdierum str. Myojin knoll TaxID=1303921 RepID=A0A0P0USJ6_9GAMM|nr:thioredoxin fold domain-containing protein [Bathymodiolus septemdierum thioautotrophic gill symbiont]RUA04199.1 MAG: hypothetical protein DSY43_06900 [Gammaproteobacteria bacterium]BAS68136.1 hypothetical protein BSEPE_1148 [endosymbiont of Bathymodiolus septemdierum str. Myojin knoll]